MVPMIALVLHTVKLDETDHYAFIYVLKLVIDIYILKTSIIMAKPGNKINLAKWCVIIKM